MTTTLEACAKEICRTTCRALKLCEHTCMATEFNLEQGGHNRTARACLRAAAVSVTDEMVRAYREHLERNPPDKWLPAIGEAGAIAAALMKAAEG